MPGSYSDEIDVGSFVPTTQVYDIGLIHELDVNSKMFKDFLITLTQSINQIALVLNTKESGYYVLQEFVDGNIFFPDPLLTSATADLPTMRQEFCITVNFGALPNAGVKTVPHNIPGINTEFSFTHVYATASDRVNLLYRSINYSNPAGDIISLDVDANNVIIETNFNATAYTTTYVVLKYIKQ